MTAGTRLVELRPDLTELTGYHSAQVDAEVRLNVNESPFPPPEEWREELARELSRLELHRYPDRAARALRQALARYHSVEPEEIFCANGSNEVLQCLLLAYGGPERRVACFEPTYALHRHIAALTATPVVTGQRAEDFTVSRATVDELVDREQPVIVFLCSPNNPTGRAEPPELVEHLCATAPGLVVVDEAYGQFAPSSALDLRAATHRKARGASAARRAASGEVTGVGVRRLVVVRTFSKTWSMAALRLGYMVADPEVVRACEQVALPYHLSAVTQLAGRLALEHEGEMRRRVAVVAEERGRVSAALGEMAVESWPSDANFILFRPLARPAREVWDGLVERSVLIRDCSSWESLQGCLRVTVGTKEENDRFLEALGEVLGDASGDAIGALR